LLAFAPDYQKGLAELELARTTPLTITSRAKLLRELKQIRATGYSINRGERIPGVCGVATPILDSSGIATAAVAVQGPAVRVTEDRFAALGALMQDVAAEVQGALPAGYTI
jgi:IclR family acetate operon transcriptional repressor